VPRSWRYRRPVARFPRSATARPWRARIASFLLYFPIGSWPDHGDGWSTEEETPAVVRWLVGAFRLYPALALATDRSRPCVPCHPTRAGIFPLAASKSQSFAGACQRHPGRDAYRRFRSGGALPGKGNWGTEQIV
jgi:hypothetical protein